MNSFLNFTLFGNTIQKWGIAIAILLGSMVAAVIASWILKNIIRRIVMKTKSELDDHLLDAVERPVVVYVNIYALWYVLHRVVTLSPGAQGKLGVLIDLLIVYNTAWLLSRVFDKILEHILIPLAEKTKSELDDILLPLFKSSLKGIVYTVATIVMINKMGYSVGAILTSFGIGGLAVALAAKDTIANVFGGIVVLTSRPFKVGERIKFQNYWAEVIEISLRNTRLQHPDFGYVISVPNSHFLTNPVINIQKNFGYLYFLDVRLSIRTTPEQLMEAMNIIGDLVVNDARAKLKDLRFVDFNGSAFTLRAYLHVLKFSDRHSVRTDIRMGIHRRFHVNHIHFAEIPYAEITMDDTPREAHDTDFNALEYVKNLQARDKAVPAPPMEKK